MRLLINGFRGYDTYELEVANCVTLIRGRSGAGKSTIFQAIYWLLYGSMRNIYPHGKKGGYLSVEMELEGNTIKRQTKPSRLTFNQLEGEEAQQAINKLYGTKDRWLATCYIQQGQHCTLLTGTASDRLDVLNQLSFCDDDPSAFIDKIEQRLKTELTQLEQITKEYNSELEQLGQPDYDSTVTSDKIAELTKLEEQLTASLSQWSDKLTQQQGLHKHKQELQARLASVSEELLTLSWSDTDRMKELIHKVEQVDKHRQAYERDAPIADDIRAKLAELPEGTCPVDATTLSQLSMQYDKQKEGIAICNSYSVDYNRQAVDNRLKDILTLRACCGDYQAYIANVNRAEQIRQQLSQLNVEQIDERQWWEIEDKYRKQQASIAICNRYCIPYQQEAIDARKSELQDLIRKIIANHEAKTKLADIDKQIQQINTKLAKLQLPQLPEDRSAELEAKRQQLARLKEAQEVLTCPHCQKGVKLQNNKLVPTVIDRVDISGIDSLSREVDKLRAYCSARSSLEWEYDTIKAKRKPLIKELERLQAIKSDIHVQQLPDGKAEAAELRQLNEVQVLDIDYQTAQQGYQRYQLIKELDSLDLTPVSDLDPHKLDAEYRALSRVEVIELQHDVPVLQQLYTRQQLQQQLQSLVTQPLHIDLTGVEELFSDCSSIEAMNKQLANAINNNQRYQRLQTQKDTLTESIAAIVIDPELEGKVSDLKTRLAKVNKELRYATYSLQVIQFKQYLEDKRVWLDDCRRSVQALGNLKSVAQRVEYELLESTVATINLMMDKALSLMFEEPITVTLSLYRQQKNGIKPVVNLSIEYRGGEYDNINQLSGGEGDRVSLALIIALNHLSGSPLLLLDETLASLDDAYRQAAIKALRLLEDKVVMVISHEDVEGNYDHTISLQS